jgi:putative serine protease PepD
MSDNQGERPDENVPASAENVPASTNTPAPPPPATPAAHGWPQPAASSPPPAAPAPAPAHPGYPAPSGAPTGQAFGLPGQPTGAHPTLTLPRDEPANQGTNAPRKKSGAGQVVGLIVAAALVGGAAGLGGAYAGISLWGGSEDAPAAAPSTITVNNPDDVTATTAIAAKVVPSVVTIAAAGEAGSGTGSGVVLSEDGYVVTNTHVVTLDGQTADAQITATTADGRVYQAEVVGTDPTYDLAVIKLVDASGLTPVEFADSDELNVGDTTVAVGAPLGLSNTVTTGIVSALNRSIAVASAAAPDDGTDSDQGEQSEEGPFFFDFGQGRQNGGQATESINIAVIQTDAAINPGNSGGALVDGEGKLIGINVAIASAGGSSGQAGSIGVGFAIPSAVAQRVADEIIESGEATHGLLGASVQSAGASGDSDIAGAYIAEVTAGGAAETAGLRAGDVVTEFDGKPITSSVDLTAQVRALAAGAETTLTYVRDGESQEIDVTLGALEG